MRRYIALLLVLINFAQFGGVSAQDDAHSLTVANWTFDVTAAVRAPYFMNTIHLGTLDDGREWIVVKMTATNTSTEKLKIHSDDIQLRSDGEAIKQTGDESEDVADELGAMSVGGSFPHDIDAGKVFDIVQVFKVAPGAKSNTLVFDFSGEWEIPLDDLIAAANGNPQYLAIEAAVPEDWTSNQSPWEIETSSYRLTLIGAVGGMSFAGPFHLGKLGEDQEWLVVTYELTNLRSEDTEVKADNQRLLVGNDELKQATEETKSVSSELDVSMLTLKLEPDASRDIVQVFKVPVAASDYTLQTSARGKLFINLTPVVQLANGDGSAVVPGSSLDLEQIDTGDQAFHAAPTAVPTSTAAPSRTPESPQEASSSAGISEESQSPTTEAPVPSAEQVSDSARVDPGKSLAGRLGGSLSDVRTRLGEPSWTDAGLIGYNSVSLGGTDAILVVYYDANETVTKFSIVYLERPVAFDDHAAILNVVAEVAPLDGSCQIVGAQTSQADVPCSSAALATVFDPEYLQTQSLGGDPGTYSYAVDPIPDEYFELVVQPGISVDSAAEQAPTDTSSAAEDAPSGSTSDFTADEIAYANEILRQTQTMADSLGRFAELTENVDIATVYTTEWQVAAAVELVIWQQTYQDALNLVPPPRFAAVHAKYLEGLSYISQSADEFAYGVDNFDIASIEQATVLMNLGNEAILEASMELQAVLGT